MERTTVIQTITNTGQNRTTNKHFLNLAIVQLLFSKDAKTKVLLLIHLGHSLALIDHWIHQYNNVI